MPVSYTHLDVYKRQSFYYEQQITAAAPDKAHESVSALPDATRQDQRILRYQMQNGQLTVYP